MTLAAKEFNWTPRFAHLNIEYHFEYSIRHNRR